jgi:Ser/Thr protein kinase RdoA (MazF antagonist)
MLCALAAALLLAGCGKQEPDPVPASCVGEPSALLAAIARAPGRVVLQDGTRLSRCVSTARSDGDLQSLGISLGRLADALRARAATDPAAALQLGYLAGAVRTGARHASSGIADQLARRMTQLATLAPDASAAAVAALARGARAGESSG